MPLKQGQKYDRRFSGTRPPISYFRNNPDTPRPDSYSVPRLIYARREGEAFFIEPSRVHMIRTNEKKLILFTDFGQSFMGDESLEAFMAAFPRQWMRLSRTFAVRVDKLDYIKGSLGAPFERRQGSAVAPATPRLEAFGVLVDEGR